MLFGIFLLVINKQLLGSWWQLVSWCFSYAEKPKEDYEDPQDLQAIREAKEIGDFPGVKHQRVNTERKREEMIALEENVLTYTNIS